MADFSFARDIPDCDVERRICKYDIGLLVLHQPGKRRLIQGIAAKHTMAAKNPEIAVSRDSRTAGRLRSFSVVLVELSMVVETFDDNIDLAHRETSRFDVEGEIDRGKLAQDFR